MKTISVAVSLVLFLALTGGATMPVRDWQFTNELGTIWLKKPQDIPLVNSRLDNDDAPPLANICETGVPRLEYDEDKSISEGEEGSAMYSLIYRIGGWSVRPLHIWGYEDYETDTCKFVIGWGTAFVIALADNKLIWATVDHNVQTRNYWERTIATNWFIRLDKGVWLELLPLGCKEVEGVNHRKYGKYCLLISANVSLLPINLFNDDYITNQVKVLEQTYLYGCSVVPERIVYLLHYKLHHFCLGSYGYVNSPFRLQFKVGGDVLVSNPAMPGFSGSPLLVYREEEWLLVGVVNSGVEGVFTAVQFIDEGIIPKVKEWFKSKERIWR